MSKLRVNSGTASAAAIAWHGWRGFECSAPQKPAYWPLSVPRKAEIGERGSLFHRRTTRLSNGRSTLHSLFSQPEE
jgi:hypothetical protein